MYIRALCIAALVVLVLSSPVLAQTSSPETLEGLIVELYSGAVRIVGLAAFLMILFAGMVRMGIIPGRAPEESTSIILDAIIGTVLLLSSVLILQSINPDLVRQDTPVFDESRYESFDSPESNTSSDASAPAGNTSAQILPAGANSGPGVTTIIRGSIYPIIIQ